MSQMKERNCSIDVFRYICAISIIICHTQPLEEVSEPLGYFTSFVGHRLAVPYFLAVAGYFYIPRLLSGKQVCLKYVTKTLQTYAIWSVPYLIINFVNQVVKGERGIISFLLGAAKSFVMDGITEHFWFFPALICAVCGTTLIHKLKGEKLLIPLSILLFIIGCLGCGYYGIGSRIPGLGWLYQFSYFTFVRRFFLMAFPFFVGGYVVWLLEKKLENNKSLVGFWCMCVGLYIIELVMIHRLNLQQNLALTIMLYPLMCATVLVLLKNPIKSTADTSRLYNTLAKFAYYTHPLFMMLITWVGDSVFSYTVTQTPLCIFTVIFTFAGGFVIYKLDLKWLNKLVL